MKVTSEIVVTSDGRSKEVVVHLRTMTEGKMFKRAVQEREGEGVAKTEGEEQRASVSVQPPRTPLSV